MKIELSLSRDYVPSWTIVDAVRELFQNALDQETQDPNNAMFFHYIDGILRIGNAHSKLTPNTLLLGTTTKAGDASTIGQFGEGYKIATLVLLRNDKDVTFFNYGAREVWKPRFVKSRRMQADVLTFFIDKESVFTRNIPADLVIEVNGISQDEWENQIVPSNLRLRNDYKVLHETPFGEIIDLPGQVFVNGLYVCTHTPYTYGYNFKPGCLKLDRDRKLASDFELQWLASKMWCTVPGALDLVEKGAADVAYILSMTHVSTSAIDKLSAEALRRFIEVNGNLAVPVTTQEEANNVPSNYKAVIVPDVYKRTIKQSPDYHEPVPEPQGPTALERLRAWYEAYSSMIEDYRIVNELDNIIKELEDNG